jgi:hypothetical protein
MALDQVRAKKKETGPCGETSYAQELLVPGFPASGDKHPDYDSHLNPWLTNDDQHQQWEAIEDIQARLCGLEQDREPAVVDIGPVTFTPEVNTYGTFTIRDLEIEDPSDIVKLHAFLVHVNESKPVYATVAGAVTDDPANVVVSVTLTGVDVTDPELTFVEGDYVLWADKDVAGTGKGGHRFEINRILTISGGSWTLQRNPTGDSRLDRSYFEGFIHPHDAGKRLYKVQVKHFDRRVRPRALYGTPESDFPRRFDFLFPSRCVQAAFITLELSTNRISEAFVQSLLPLVDTTSDGDPTTSPVAPGLRTCAGDGIIIPCVQGTGNVVTANDQGDVVMTVDSASVRAIYAYVQTAPVGADLIISFKYRPLGGAWTAYETLTIPTGTRFSFVVGSNEPNQRRMPYSLDWPPVLIPQNAELGFDVTQVGTTIPGAALKVHLET